MGWWADARARRAEVKARERREAQERKALNAAGTPEGVAFAILDRRLVAYRVDLGVLAVQTERGGAFQPQQGVTGVRRGLRPWMAGLQESGLPTRWLRLRGRARRDGPGDVGDPHGFGDPFPSSSSPLDLLIVVVWVVYLVVWGIPVGTVAAVQELRARRRLRAAVGAG